MRIKLLRQGWWQVIELGYLPEIATVSPSQTKRVDGDLPIHKTMAGKGDGQLRDRGQQPRSPRKVFREGRSGLVRKVKDLGIAELLTAIQPQAIDYAPDGFGHLHHLENNVLPREKTGDEGPLFLVSCIVRSASDLTSLVSMRGH